MIILIIRVSYLHCSNVFTETEVLAMLSLKKFRHLRRSYYPNDAPR